MQDSTGLPGCKPDRDFQLMIEALEQIFKQERQQTTSQLQPLIAIVVPVIHKGTVYHGIQHPPDHEGNVCHLHQQLAVSIANTSSHAVLPPLKCSPSYTPPPPPFLHTYASLQAAE